MKSFKHERKTLYSYLNEHQIQALAETKRHVQVSSSCRLSPAVTPLQITILPDLVSSLCKKFNKEKLFCAETPIGQKQKTLENSKEISQIVRSKHSKRNRQFCLNFKQKIDENRKTIQTHSTQTRSMNISYYNRCSDQVEQSDEIPFIKYCKLLIRYKNSNRKKKCRFIILLEEIVKKFSHNAQQFQEEFSDLKKLSSMLIKDLQCEEGEKELKTTGVFQVNKDLARLVFHVVHEIIYRKTNKQNLIKSNKQIQFYSRRLNFHNLTLRVCFDIAGIYQQFHKDEEESAHYYSKALRQAIFVGDKYSEEKAIDNLGIVSYLEGKIERASYCHNKIEEIKNFKRNMKSQEFSNEKQIEELYREKREKIMSKNKRQGEKQKSCHENYGFLQGHFDENFQLKNKKMFKKNIKYYIQCPKMRYATLKANSKINKIEKIGTVKKCSTSNFLQKLRTNYSKGVGQSRQIMLTHRSFNRVNPDNENQQIQKEKKIILDFLYYVQKKSTH